MSIQSSFYAEYANEVKSSWAEQLNNVIINNGFSERYKLQKIAEIIERIKNFQFGE